MAFFIHPNQCLLFFRDPQADLTLQRLTEVLAEEGVAATGGAEPLALRCGDGPVLYVSIVRGEAAALLARRLLGRGRKHRALVAALDAYVQVTFESLDDVLAEMNTLISVQGSLQQATGGVLYCAWNGAVSGPDE